MLGRYRPFAYFAGATAARTADEMSAPALLLLGLAVAGSARTASLLYAGLTVTAAAGGPPLGALLDRAARPGRLLAAALGGYAAGLAIITLSMGHVPVPLLVAAAGGAGLLAPALTGGWTSRLADVGPAAQLSRGHALDAATYSLASLVGPALAGVIAAAAGARSAMAAAITLLVLAVPAAAGMPARAHASPGARAPARPALVRELRAGAAAIAGRPALRRITLGSTIAYLGTGMFVVACPLLGRRYLGGAAQGALLLAVLAAASLAATAATARWPPRPRPDTVFVIATVVAGCGLAALSVASSAAWITALVAVTGLADGPQLAAVFAVRQREAPPRLRGQVFTTAASLKISAGALGAGLAGVLAQHSVALVLVAAAAAQVAALIACRAATASSQAQLAALGSAGAGPAVPENGQPNAARDASHHLGRSDQHSHPYPRQADRHRLRASPGDRDHPVTRAGSPPVDAAGPRRQGQQSGQPRELPS
jgi:MFS family permease